jgi:hypothetical protein
MKRASTGWPVKGLSTRLRPARGKKGSTKIVRAPIENWRKRRAASNAEACLTGYSAKAKRILNEDGNHRAVCCPNEMIVEGRRRRESLRSAGINPDYRTA